MRRPSFVNCTSVCLALGFAAGTPVTKPTRPPAATIEIMASDYAFRAPGRAAAGLTRVRMVNRGREPHHVVITRLEDTLSLSGFFKLMQAGAATGPFRDVGGPGIVGPGDTAVVHVRLQPGRYALSCWITAPDGRPHLMKGMLAELAVGPAVGAVPDPRVDAVITARDHRLDVSGPLSAGVRTIRFDNAGPQEHDFQLVALAPGKSVADVMAWADAGMHGTTPGRLAGGVSGLVKGERAWAVVRLRKGRYALLCGVPDATDGRPHYRHGMAHEVRVR